MKRLPFLLIALVLVFACTDTLTEPEPAIDLVVAFGTEPSPFFPSATNELNATIHHLGVIQEKVGSLCVPPEPCKPLPEQPIRGQLGAMENELNALDERIKAVLRVDPDPFAPADSTDAVVGVYGAANLLNEAIIAKMGFEPTPFLEPAFMAVEGAAKAIMWTVYESGHCPQTPFSGTQCPSPDIPA